MNLRLPQHKDLTYQQSMRKLEKRQMAGSRREQKTLFVSRAYVLTVMEFRMFKLESCVLN